MEVVELTSDLEALWTAFVRGRDDWTVYHTLGWRDLLARTYGYRPRYFLALENGEAAGVLPLMYVSSLLTGKRLSGLPFSHHVPLLGSSSARTALLDHAKRIAEAQRCRLILKTPLEEAEACEFSLSPDNFNTELNLEPDEEALWKLAHPKKARWAARRAEKEGVEIVRDVTEDTLREYEAMEVETRHRQGAPPYPTGYFARLFELIDGAVLQLARLEGRAVAGNVLLPAGRSVIYGYGASIPEGQKVLANDLLVWEAIKFAKQRGALVYDFGTTPVHHRTLLKFKEKWGGATRELPYAAYPPGGSAGPKRDSRAVELTSRVLRRMPLSLFRLAGPWLLKQVG